ncbi:MAG: small multi-drug export protein [Candidatus Omnitrophica bacterium]|nr:small multi-drug export protein [Candidatus Omnitrophota bacterium]
MLERIFLFFKNFPPQWAVFLTAMLPVSELRGAIPLGFSLGMPWQKIIIFSLLGNIFPVPFILFLLDPIAEYLREFKLWKKFFNWLYIRTQKKARVIERYKFWGLVIFVGIPLPMTGAWTGAVAASLLDMRFKKALMGISLGIVIAGTIVTFLVLTGKIIISFSFK